MHQRDILPFTPLGQFPYRVDINALVSGSTLTFGFIHCRISSGIDNGLAPGIGVQFFGKAGFHEIGVLAVECDGFFLQYRLQVASHLPFGAKDKKLAHRNSASTRFR